MCGILFARMRVAYQNYWYSDFETKKIHAFYMGLFY